VRKKRKTGEEQSNTKNPTASNGFW
jgi:hypothetical protein